MKNDEQKNKIVEVLKEAMEPIEYGGDSEHAPEVHYPTEEEIADALIAAGIGDVWEITEKAEKAIVSLIKQNKEAEHRAARAEKALMTVCVNVVTDEEDDIAVEPRARVLYKAYLKQAKKELAEERKDD